MRRLSRLAYFMVLMFTLSACKLTPQGQPQVREFRIGGDGTPIEQEPVDPILVGVGASPKLFRHSPTAEYSVLPQAPEVKPLTFSENFDLMRGPRDLGEKFFVQVPTQSEIELAKCSTATTSNCESAYGKFLILRGAVPETNPTAFTRLVTKFHPVLTDAVGVKSHTRIKHVVTEENPQPYSVHSLLTTNGKMLVRLICADSGCRLLTVNGAVLGVIDNLDLQQWHNFDLSINLVQMSVTVSVDGAAPAISATLTPKYIEEVFANSASQKIGISGVTIGTVSGKAGELHIDNLKIENLKPTLVGERLVDRQCLTNLLELSAATPAPALQVNYAWCLTLGRNPTTNEVSAQTYAKRIALKELPPIDIALALYSSIEFQQRYRINELSNLGYVRLMFRLLLLRQADAPSEAHLVNQLNALNKTPEMIAPLRKQMFLDLAGSTEFLTKHPTLNLMP